MISRLPIPSSLRRPLLFRLLSSRDLQPAATSHSSPSSLPKDDVHANDDDGHKQQQQQQQQPRARQRWNHGYHRTGQLRRRKMREPARDNAYDFTHWDLHRSQYRHFRHLALFPMSATFHRLLFPDLCCVAGVAGGLSYYNEVVAAELGKAAIACPLQPFMLTSFALGLLLVFRTNTSNNRFEEGRVRLGAMINSSRALVRVSSTKLHDADPALADRMVRLVGAFIRVAIFHLTKDGDLAHVDGRMLYTASSSSSSLSSSSSPSSSSSSLDDELRVMLGQLLDADEADAVVAAPHRPLNVLHRMAEVIAEADLDPIISGRLDVEVRELELSVGACERILRTPIPTSYTRHTSRFLAIWTSLLPFALWPVCGSYGTVPASILVAYSLLAIEDIGVVIEEPFDILPMWRLAAAIDASCDVGRETMAKRSGE